MLFAVVLSSLAYKRQRESPQRDLVVWGMDVAKQVASSGMAHLCGMGFAVLLAWGQNGGPDGSSECAWYFVLFTMDTTVGVLVTVSLHNYIVRG